MRVVSRTDSTVTFVVAGRVCEVTREEYARIRTRVEARKAVRRTSAREIRELMRETSPGRMQAMVGANAPAVDLDLTPAGKAPGRFGLTAGPAQPARVGFGQSDATYAPGPNGIRRPNVGGTESALSGRISPVRKGK